MATRSRAKKAPECTPTQPTPAASDACTTELFTELRKQRDEVTAITQRAAAAEERVFHLTASLKEVLQEIDVLREKMHDTRARLTETERSNAKLEGALRADTRKAIEDIRMNVKELTQQNDVCAAANVADHLTAIRAESLVSELDDARSEVSSVAPRYSHAPQATARRRQ
jgi:chromosome segregation ATPase